MQPSQPLPPLPTSDMLRGTPAQPPPPAPLSPEWLKAAILIVSVVASWFVAQHGTTPTPPLPPVPIIVKPTPTPPVIVVPPHDNPTPAPIPTPIDTPVAAITVTDSDGTVVTDTAIPGTLLVFSSKNAIHAEDPLSVIWITEQGTKHWTTSDNSTLTLVAPSNTCLKVGQVVTFHDKLAYQFVSIKCGTAPQPPPPSPTPAPAPAPVGSRKLRLAIVEDTSQRSPDMAMLLDSFNSWSAFGAAGHSYVKYNCGPSPSTEAGGTQAIAAMKASNLIAPTIILYDQVVGTQLYIGKCPLDLTQIKALVSQYGGAL